MLAQLLLAREWLQAAVSALAMFAGYGIVWVISTAISSLNDFTLPMALVSAATSYGSGLLPDIYAGMASFLTAAGPRRTRSTVKWSWNILYAIAAGDGGAFVAFGYRHAGFDGRRSHGGHAYPIRGRHAE